MLSRCSFKQGVILSIAVDSEIYGIHGSRTRAKTRPRDSYRRRKKKKKKTKPVDLPPAGCLLISVVWPERSPVHGLTGVLVAHQVTILIAKIKIT
jgi:hypothetical protein